MTYGWLSEMLVEAARRRIRSVEWYMRHNWDYGIRQYHKTPILAFFVPHML